MRLSAENSHCLSPEFTTVGGVDVMRCGGDCQPRIFKREQCLDVAKFVAIFLVVVYHTRCYAGDLAVYAGTPWLENLGYVTSVSVFFCISGYLSRSLMSEWDIAKLARRSLFYLWPILSIVLLGSVLVRVVLYSSCDTPPGGWIRFVFSVGWFFWCLALCEVLTFFAYGLARGCAWLLTALLGVCFLALWALPVGLFHVVEMLPVYWFGLFVLPRLLVSRWVLPIGIVALASHLLAVFACGDFAICGLSYHAVTSHLANITAREFGLQILRWLLSLTGGAGSILVIRAVITRWVALGRIAPLGTQTLGVFFLHIHLLTVYYAIIGWTGGGLFGRLAVAASVFAVAFVLSWLTNRWTPLAAILWNPLLMIRKKEHR